MTTYERLQKILGGNRITLPKEFIQLKKLKKGDPVILKWSTTFDNLTVELAEVKPRKEAA